jgi:hypothetical protein
MPYTLRNFDSSSWIRVPVPARRYFFALLRSIVCILNRCRRDRDRCDLVSCSPRQNRLPWINRAVLENSRLSLRSIRGQTSHAIITMTRRFVDCGRLYLDEVPGRQAMTALRSVNNALQHPTNRSAPSPHPSPPSFSWGVPKAGEGDRVAFR